MGSIELQLVVAENGYFFVDIGGKLWLLDTGCPRSFSCSGVLALDAEHVYTLQTTCMCINVAQIKQYITEPPFVGLLGMDVLGQFDAVIDCPRGVMQLLPPGSFAPSSSCGCPTSVVPLKMLCSGLPALKCGIGAATDLMLVLDTGATLTFLRSDAFTPEEHTLPRSHNDFHCMTGRFSTFVARRDIRLSPEFSIRHCCGHLPAKLQTALECKGIAGIIGNALFRDCVVTLSAATRRMFLTAVEVPTAATEQQK